MTRKRPESASRKWSVGLSTPEASRKRSFGFLVPQQNASVHADPSSSGECRINRRSVVMSIWRIYALAIPIFALLLFGGSWPAAAGVGSCSSAFWSCGSQCNTKFREGSAANNACYKNCRRKYCQ
jgi:hypothetical protein